LALSHVPAHVQADNSAGKYGQQGRRLQRQVRGVRLTHANGDPDEKGSQCRGNYGIDREDKHR
jgi:hypothetical protein